MIFKVDQVITLFITACDIVTNCFIISVRCGSGLIRMGGIMMTRVGNEPRMGLFLNN